MGYTLKQSQTAQPLVFLMVDSADHVSPKTGLAPTVTLSKNGAAFAVPTGAVTEIGNGWYKVAGNATDANTLGPLVLHATATGADPVDDTFIVVAFDPQDSAALGLSRIDVSVGSRSSLSASDVWAVGTRALTDKSGFALSSAGVQAVWDALTSAMTAAGSVGRRIADNLNVAVSSRSSHGPSDVRSEMDSNSVAFDNLQAYASVMDTRLSPGRASNLDLLDASVAAVAAQVWNYLLIDVATPGTFGKLLKDTAGIDTPGTTTLLSRLASALSVTAGKVDVNDRTGFALAASERVKLAASQPDYVPAKAGDAMTLTSGERTSVASAVWGATTRTLTSFGTLVADVWAAVVDSPGVSSLLARLTSARAAKLDNLDVASSTLLAASAYVAPANADVAAVKVVTDKLGAMVETDGPDYRFDANALELAPTGGGGSVVDAQAVASAVATLLSAPVVTVTYPVSPNGAITLIQDDDYDADESSSIDFVDVSGTWPDLSGAAVKLAVWRGDEGFTVTGSVLTPVSEGQKIRFEVPRSTTQSIDATRGNFQYRIYTDLAGGHRRTLRRGVFVLVEARP